MVSLQLVSEKQQHPPAKEKSRAPNPLHKQKKNDPHKNHGYADSMQQLVRRGFVFVIVLCHVVRQARHVAHLPAALCGLPSRGCGDIHFNVDFIPNWVNFLERPGTTKSIKAGCLLRLQTPYTALLGSSYKSRRPSIAFSMVTSSAYSRSAPTGMPTPMRVTRTPSGLSNLER